MGSVVGVALSWAILRAAPSVLPPRTIPAAIVLGTDWRLMAFAVTLTFVTALASGVAPAWQAMRVSLVEAMGTGNRASTGKGGRLRAASFVCCDVPLNGYSMGQSFEVVGEPSIDPAHQPLAHFQLAGPRYFETMGTFILRGRAFTERDTEATTPVCIVNEEFVRRYLAGRDPIGARVSVRSLAMRESTWFRARWWASFGR